MWNDELRVRVYKQIFSDLDFGYLDYLFIDSPPRLNYELISFCRLIPSLDGVILIYRPGASIDLIKNDCEAFKILNLKILGVVARALALKLQLQL